MLVRSAEKPINSRACVIGTTELLHTQRRKYHKPCIVIKWFLEQHGGPGQSLDPDPIAHLCDEIRKGHLLCRKTELAHLHAGSSISLTTSCFLKAKVVVVVVLVVRGCYFRNNSLGSFTSRGACMKAAATRIVCLASSRVWCSCSSLRGQ